MIDILQLEKDLTEYFAEQLGLVVDGTIFRAKVPESVKYGAAVRILNQYPNNDFSQPLYSVQITGKYPSRDESVELATKCARLFPVYGEQTEHFNIVFIQSDGGINAPVSIEDKGQRFHFLSVNLTVSVLTRKA